ncbi:MAG: DUF6456 domain-containing protein [Pseudomonadota bacterium]
MSKLLDEEAITKLKNRLVKHLAKGDATVVVTRDRLNALVERSNSQKIKVPMEILRSALSDGLVSQYSSTVKEVDFQVKLSAEGRERAQKLKTPSSSVGRSVQSDNVLVVNDGSPLARLYFTKRNATHGWLSKEEFHAGERLRIDFEKSQVSPSLGANWDAFGMPRKPRGASGAENASDFADGARSRLHAALNAVGPEMGDLLLDVCCFLKGLERVEADRGWPRRSAKLLLKVALANLDRHYNVQPVQTTKRLKTWRVNMDA